MAVAKKTPAKKTVSKAATKDAAGDAIVVKRAPKKLASKKPVVKKAPKQDEGEKITVSVGPPAEKITVTKTPKIVPVPEPEDIPEEILPTEDELDLHDELKSTKKADEIEDMWAAELIDDVKDETITDEEAKQTTAAAPPEVVQPEPDSVIDEPDDGKLLGFIQQHVRPGVDEANTTHPAGERARAQLAKPKIYDTQIVHLPVDVTHHKKRTSHSVARVLGVVIVAALVAAAAYIIVDAGLLGKNLKVPYEVIK